MAETVESVESAVWAMAEPAAKTAAPLMMVILARPMLVRTARRRIHHYRRGASVRQAATSAMIWAHASNA